MWLSLGGFKGKDVCAVKKKAGKKSNPWFFEGKSKFGFPKGCAYTPTVGIISGSGGKDELEACVKAYRTKFKDLIEWSHVEPSGIAFMLWKGIQEDDSKCLEALSNLAKSALQWLLHFDPEKVTVSSQNGLISTIAILTEACNALNQLAARQPAFFEFFASRRAEWPSLYFRRKKNQKAMATFLTETLKLGELYKLNLKGKTSYSIESKIAEMLFHRLEHYRVDLGWRGEEVDRLREIGPLKRCNSDKWWKEAAPLFHRIYGENFWENKIFEHWLGRSPKYSFEKPGLLSAAILKEMKKAFKNIAPRTGKHS